MDHKHVKIGVCLDPNQVKMVRHIRLAESDEVYAFNADGHDPDSHNKHLKEKIKSLKCSKGKTTEIDWYLFPPYLKEYLDESGDFVFNSQRLSLERESPVFSGKSLSLSSWQCLEYMPKFQKKYEHLSGAEKFKILQSDFAGNEKIQELIFQHKSTGTWHSFIEIFDHHLKQEYFNSVHENENIKFTQHELLLELARNYLDFYMLAYKGATMQDAIIRTCSKLKESAGLRLILNSTFQKNDFLRDLDQMIKAANKPAFVTPASKSSFVSQPPNNTTSLFDKSFLNKSSLDQSQSNPNNTMDRLNNVIDNVAKSGSSLDGGNKKQRT